VGQGPASCIERRPIPAAPGLLAKNPAAGRAAFSAARGYGGDAKSYDLFGCMRRCPVGNRPEADVGERRKPPKADAPNERA
jgi:hypothetical protein